MYWCVTSPTMKDKLVRVLTCNYYSYISVNVVLLPSELRECMKFALIFHLLNVMFCTVEDDRVLMFPTFLQIILDLYPILYIRVRGLRLLKFRCMRLICCLSVYLLEIVRQHCPVGFLGQMCKQL